jgi:hypothetical protein
VGEITGVDDEEEAVGVVLVEVDGEEVGTGYLCCH